MSDYNPASEVMQLCKKNALTAGEPAKVSKELFTVLAKGREISELSDGAFDVTVGPVVKLWRIARKTEKLPDPKLLADVKKVGYRNLELDVQNQTVKLLIPGMQIDLGGIAKGYAADEGLDVLGEVRHYQGHGCGLRRHRRGRPSTRQASLAHWRSGS